MGASTQIIGKIKKHVHTIRTEMRAILEAHENKSRLNREIVERIKTRGTRYSHEFSKDKKRMLNLIEQQERELKAVLAEIDHVDRLLQLIINTEQVNLLMEQRRRYGGISSLVDPISEPFDDFSEELEEVKLLHDSFDVLRIELEKQKEYVKHFDLEEDDIDFEYFRKSAEYEESLSNKEVVSLSHLSTFCSTLEEQLGGRLKSTKPIGSDVTTKDMEKRLNRYPLGERFSPTIGRFLNTYVPSVIAERSFSKTFVLIVIFLLSRLAYFEKERFERTILVAQIAYRLAPTAGFDADKRDALILAAIVGELSYFATGVEGESIDDSERGVLREYYARIQDIFMSKIAFLDTILEESRKPTKTNVVTWPQLGGRYLAALQHSIDVIEAHGPSEDKIEHAFTRTMKITDGMPLARAFIGTYGSLKKGHA
jgi:hypothetical protein